MKYFYLLLLALFIQSCGPYQYKTMSSGKENESFVIVLTENGKYDNGVVLTIDDKTPVTIENVRKVKQQRKAEVVKTTPGKHNLKIMRNGSIVYNQDVLMGLQETKKIILP